MERLIPKNKGQIKIAKTLKPETLLDPSTWVEGILILYNVLPVFKEFFHIKKQFGYHANTNKQQTKNLPHYFQRSEK